MLNLKMLERCYDISDLRLTAKKNLPRFVFDFMEGAAEDEVSMKANNKNFGRYALLPQVLTDVSRVDMETTVMGQKIPIPLILSPRD